MDKRYHASLGVELPLLGFGTMRLPSDDDDNIEVKPAVAMLMEALERGVNYFDTAQVYHGGKSEAFLGEHFFSQLSRERFLVATKLPVFKIEELAQCEPIFAAQLTALGLSYVDFYLAHSIDKERWLKFKELGGVTFLQRIRNEGRVRFLGFSYHGAAEELAAILDDFDWDFVQLQINYYDWPAQTQNAELQYAAVAKRALPLIVMEPLRGRALAQPPAKAAKLFKAAQPEHSAARWALRWLGSLPAVSMVLSAMSTLAQVQDNLDTFSGFEPLTPQEQETVRQVQQILLDTPSVPCTGCEYCASSCPQGIRISFALDHYANYQRLQSAQLLEHYLAMTEPEQRVERCTACGACKTYCPQKIEIPVELARFQRILAKHEKEQRQKRP